MIGSVNTGGGATAFAFIVATYPVGSTCTCTCTETGKVLRAKDTSGSWVFDIPYAGTWTVATDANHSKSVSISYKAQVENATILVPNAYQQVEYLQAVGATSSSASESWKGQYINTGLILDGDSKIEAKYMPVSLGASQCRIYGSEKIDTWNYKRTLTIGSNGTTTGYGVSSPTDITVAGYNSLNTIYEVISDKNHTYINGELVATHTYQSFNTVNALYLFADSFGTRFDTYGNKRIYYFKVSKNGVPVADYIPCYNKSTFAAGMYDLVSDTFKPNDGQNDFTVGGDVA